MAPILQNCCSRRVTSSSYIVHGIKRRTSLFNTQRIDHLYQDPHDTDRRLFLHYGDLTDSSSLIRIVEQVQPDEIYNLAAQSHVSPLRGETFVTRKITRAMARIVLGTQDCLYLGNARPAPSWAGNRRFRSASLSPRWSALICMRHAGTNSRARMATGRTTNTTNEA